MNKKSTTTKRRAGASKSRKRPARPPAMSIKEEVSSVLNAVEEIRSGFIREAILSALAHECGRVGLAGPTFGDHEAFGEAPGETLTNLFTRIRGEQVNDVVSKANQIEHLLTDPATKEATRKVLQGCLLEISKELEMGVADPALARDFYLAATKKYGQFATNDLFINRPLKEIDETLTGASEKRIAQILKRHKIVAESPETAKPQLAYDKLREAVAIITADDTSDERARALLVLINELRRHRSDRIYVEDTASTVALEVFKETKTFESAAFSFAERASV